MPTQEVVEKRKDMLDSFQYPANAFNTVNTFVWSDIWHTLFTTYKPFSAALEVVSAKKRNKRVAHGVLTRVAGEMIRSLPFETLDYTADYGTIYAHDMAMCLDFVRKPLVIEEYSLRLARFTLMRVLRAMSREDGDRTRLILTNQILDAMDPSYGSNLERDAPKKEFKQEWRTSTAVSVAKAMLKDNNFSSVPVLADALEEAGLDDQNVLGRMRRENATFHKTCWAVAQLTGRVRYV